MNEKSIYKIIRFNVQERRSILSFIILFALVNLIGFWLDQEPKIQIMDAREGISFDSLEMQFEGPSSKSIAVSQIKFAEKKASTSSPSVRKREKNTAGLHEKETLNSAPNITAQTEQISDKPLEIKGSFNPNIASVDEMQSLGVPKRVASNIFNYVNRGGEFKTKRELLKMYAIDEEIYGQLEPYIQISSSKSSVLPLVIDINTADSKTWQKIKGIGPYYAGKIIKYRNKLGGFYSIDQIKETWDLPSEVIDQNKSHFILKHQPERINLRIAEYKSLIIHPYIDKRETKLLLKLKNIVDKIDEQVFIDIFGEDKWPIMQHYIDYDNSLRS